MKCPFCAADQLVVTNSRSTAKNSRVWRRRKCLNCKGLITTYESVDLSYLHVEKSDGRVQLYDNAKLFSGIYQAALQKKDMDRGDRGVLAKRIVDAVEGKILQKKTKKVTTSEIRDIVLHYLVGEDPLLFLSFLAYFSKHKKQALKREILKYF